MVRTAVKKPVSVQFVEWTGTNDTEVIKFCNNRGVDYDDTNGLFIYTLEGRMKASIGDMIIKGVAGECYPCKPDIFKLTYDVTKVTDFKYCQSKIEGHVRCTEQCNHCGDYYGSLED